VIFFILEIIALNWLVSTHAMHNGRVSSIGIECANSWTDMLGTVSSYYSIQESNKDLNSENARLRTENMRLRSTSNISSDSITTYYDVANNWRSVSGEVIRTSTHFKDNLLVANKGRLDNVFVGSGMLDNGSLAGKVVEVTDNECLVFPVIHRNVEWSVRIGEEGAVGRMVWDARDVKIAKVVDITKSSLVLPGEKVYTTGFQGVFPADVFVGEVIKVAVTAADEFKTVIIELGADYSNIRHVEFLQDLSISYADSLISIVK
jgi:cell shape-determining protein MreC